MKEGKEPLASTYPKIAKGTLVDWHKTWWPGIPGVRYPTVIQQPPFADYGPKFFSDGVITNEPPTVKGHYKVFVMRCDIDGNERTLPPPDVALPLATYTGWNLRRKEVGAEGMLASLLGSCIPFPRTQAEANKNADPRPPIEGWYKSFREYRDRYSSLCKVYQEQGALLPEDIELLVKNLESRRKLFPAAEGK